MTKKFSTNTLCDEDLDKLFCLYGKKWGVKKLLLKAVALIESSLNERAYRYEANFWNKYLKNNPEWKDRDPAEVSASYGLMQRMYTTFWGLGFRGKGDDLYDPIININLGAKLLAQLRDKVRASGVLQKFPALFEWEVVLSLYNGGAGGNPDSKGILRNQKYADRVMNEYYALKKKEKECEE